MANKPWRFTTKNVTEFKLAFNIFRADADVQDRSAIIGSAVALLDSLKQGLGPKRESLIRDFTIPILRKDTLEFMGTLTFYFLIITPYPYPRTVPQLEPKWGLEKHSSSTIIGYRGELDEHACRLTDNL